MSHKLRHSDTQTQVLKNVPEWVREEMCVCVCYIDPLDQQKWLPFPSFNLENCQKDAMKQAEGVAAKKKDRLHEVSN